MKIHPTAVISPLAKIADNVEVGPYAIIDDRVILAKGVKVYAHAYITGATEIGENTEIHMGAVVGHIPQDWSFTKETQSAVRIGKNNLIREYVTIHRGSKEGSATVIGDGNFLMAHSHVAHDCQIGNKVVLANGVLLAGYVTIGDGAFISGNVVIHQFVKIGRLTMISGGSRIGKDVPPFMTASGTNRVYSINAVGLKRAGYGLEQERQIKQAYKLLYLDGKNVAQGLETLQGRANSSEVLEIIEFIKNSKRGLCACGIQRRNRDEEP
ncbi:MAG: acyl-ACP--UDP-N-acetylglucosamine O-acyltransferase [Candidatus Omnitrophica bacterium]|nr:acyl-ACP--UDP-N-acetylglucosamine O-acyltransferase [Candidatus Omnitrophota bacterium]